MAGGINKLTAVAVQKAKEPGYYGDGGGLWLQLSKLGGKSWAFRFTLHGKRREMGLGAVHTVTLAEARQTALGLRKQVRDGIDPIEQRKADKDRAAALAAKAGKTFADCVKAVLESKSPEFRNSKTAKLWQSRLETYAYPTFETRIVGTITNDEVAAVLEPIWRKKYPTAKKLRAYLESVFDYAKAMKYREGDNPAAWKGALQPILGKPNHETEHCASLPYVGIGAFIAALRKREAFAARAVEFAILTAARSGEVRGATWGEIDLAARTWTIPAKRMKGGKLHCVPLCDAAVSLLKALPEPDGSKLVFPAPHGGEFTDAALPAVIKRMHDSEVEAGRAGYLDPKVNRVATLHGFRTSFKEWARSDLEAKRYRDEVSELALAHVNSDATRAAYARDKLLPQRMKMMAEWGKYCGTVPTKDAAKVIRFERANSQ